MKLYMLTIATSYRIKESERIVKSEYIVSQSIMMACKRLGYDGVAYFSKRGSDDIFAFCAINLALFVDYEEEYSKIIDHMKMDDAFNFGLYKQLHGFITNKAFELYSTRIGIVTNIGNYNRHYSYRETQFYDFDKLLFASWRDKSNVNGKEQIPWGVPID